MLEAVTAGLGTVIGWVGTVIDALTAEAGELSSLLPLFAVGISISAILLGEMMNAEVKSGNIGEG